ncbi:MAG: prephenate dehydrogenase/arogenate dehydrogenase family protein [Methanobacteriota archaeon]
MKLATMPKAVVVGGRGSMGRWFVDYLDSQGYSVVTADPRGPLERYNRDESYADHPDEYDVILLATPMDATDAILARLARARRPLVLDIASIKSPIEARLVTLARSGVRVASLHPMWGPETTVLSDKNLLVLDCGDATAAADARGLFAETAVHIVDLPVAEHDRLMAYCLGLSHAVNLVFAKVLAGAGFPAERLREIGGPTFRGQAALASAVAHENKEMYHQIQALNAHSGAVHEAIRRELEALVSATGDRKRFVAFMAACEEYFGKEEPR